MSERLVVVKTPRHTWQIEAPIEMSTEEFEIFSEYVELAMPLITWTYDNQTLPGSDEVRNVLVERMEAFMAQGPTRIESPDGRVS